MKRVAALSLLVAFGCSSDPVPKGSGAQAGTKTGNGITLEFGTVQQALALPPDAGLGMPIGDTTAAGTGLEFHIEEAGMALAEIQLLPSGPVSCGEQSASPDVLQCEPELLTIRGEFIVDLLARTSTPSLADIALPVGVYETVEARLGLVAGHPTFASASLVVAGSFELPGQSLPFRFSVAPTEPLQFLNLEGSAVDDSGVLSALIDVTASFGQLELTSCLEADQLAAGPDSLELGAFGGCGDLTGEWLDALRTSTQLLGSGSD